MNFTRPSAAPSTLAGLLFLSAGTASAADSLEALKQRVQVLERKLEIQDEQAAEKAKTAISTSANEKGFGWKSADGSYELKFRGLIQADGRFFLGDDNNATTFPATGNGNTLADTFILRRLRPTFEGTLFKYVGFRLTPEFTGDSATIVDAYLDLRFDPAINLRFGKVKGPVDLERLQSGSAITFIERGFPTELAPNRDIGIQLQGTLFSGTTHYTVGIYNGTPDGRDAVAADVDNRKELGARLFFEPFKNDYGFFRGLGFGVGGTSGKKKATPTFGAAAGDARDVAVKALVNNLNPRYRTPGQNQFYSYAVAGSGTLATAANTVLADGDHYRIAPQAYFYNGSLGVLTEYITSTQQVSLAGVRKTFTNEAWQGQISYLLTGEDASFSGPAKILTPFAVGKEGWGAVEVAVRVGTLLVDGDIFASGFTAVAGTASSARRADTTGFALNWHLNNHVKIGADYDWTRFQRGGNAAGTDRPDERAAITRLQVSF